MGDKMNMKLSELDNKTLLLAGDNVITKETILSDLEYYREKYKDEVKINKTSPFKIEIADYIKRRNAI